MGPGCITRFYNLYLMPILYLKKRRKKVEKQLPIFSSMRSDKVGLHMSNQRLGVIPLVLFWNFSGHNSAKGLNKSALIRSEWMRATPLTAWDPTMAWNTIIVIVMSLVDQKNVKSSRLWKNLKMWYDDVFSCNESSYVDKFK